MLVHLLKGVGSRPCASPLVGGWQRTRQLEPLARLRPLEPLAKLCQEHRPFTNVLSPSSGKPPNINNRLKKIILFSGGFCTFGGLGAFLRYYYNRRREFVGIQQVATAIDHSTSQLLIGSCVTRSNLESALKRVIQQSKDLRTVLVVGPRGSGKSDLVHMTLKDTKRVINVKLKHFSSESFAESILYALKFHPTQVHNMSTSPVIRVQQALTQCKGSLPIIVVKADHCSANELQNLLLLLKEWGPDRGLLRSIVTFSSGAAQDLTIDMEKLHTETLEVGDLTVAESHDFLRIYCKPKVECTEEEFSLFCEKLFPRIGTRPLHLQKFCFRLPFYTKVSLEELYEEADKYVKDLTSTYVYDLIRFKKQVAGENQSKQDRFDTLFEHLQQKPLPLRDVVKKLGISTDKFLKLNSSYGMWHPFFIQSNMVRLNHAEVKKTIEKKALER